MPIVVINSPGTVLATDVTNFTLRSKGRKIGRIPACIIDSLVVSHEVEVTRKALGRLGRSGIPVTLLGRDGQVQARIVPAWGSDPTARLAQARLHDDAETTLEMARSLVAAKTANQIGILNQWLSNHRDPEVVKARDTLKERLEALGEAGDLDALRGHEGYAARLYFPAFGRTLTVEWTRFSERNRRPPLDPVNALLSYTYAVFGNRLHSFLETSGLDPYIGTLHNTTPRRASLAFDLLEPFRPALADRFVRRVLNLGQFQTEHFEELTFPKKAVLLNAEGRRTFAETLSLWLPQCDSDNIVGMTSPDRLLAAAVEGYRDALKKGKPLDYLPYRLPGAPS